MMACSTSNSRLYPIFNSPVIVHVIVRIPIYQRFPYSPIPHLIIITLIFHLISPSISNKSNHINGLNDITPYPHIHTHHLILNKPIYTNGSYHFLPYFYSSLTIYKFSPLRLRNGGSFHTNKNKSTHNRIPSKFYLSNYPPHQVLTINHFPTLFIILLTYIIFPPFTQFFLIYI
jgi:hypothetical protein